MLRLRSPSPPEARTWSSSSGPKHWCGTPSRVMMGRALRELEADGLVEREHGGGIRILDEERLAGLVTVASPDGAPAL